MATTDAGLSMQLFAPLRGAGLTLRDRRDHPLLWAAYGGQLAQLPPARTRALVAEPADMPQGPSPRDVATRLAVVCGMVMAASAVVVLLGGTVTSGGAGRLWTALLTGLTAGGLSCLAVQGGLLAAATKSNDDAAAQDQAPRILAFLVAKLTAYTVLGALLGLFGAAFQPSPGARGVVQAIIGLFMVGTAIQMIRPNRWTRRLVLEPPPRVRSWLRARARRGADLSDAAGLGALTVLIPCGVTQAMLASAMAEGTPMGGALVMAAFTLGTCPVFFALAYGTSSLGAHARTYFNRAVAVLLIVMGFVALQTGFALAGHPLPIRPIMASDSSRGTTGSATTTGTAQEATITVSNDGYAPAKTTAKASTDLRLVFVTSKVTGCTRTIVVPDLDIERVLPPTGSTVIDIPAQKPGTTVRWVCGMGMYSGQVVFD